MIASSESPPSVLSGHWLKPGGIQRGWSARVARPVSLLDRAPLYRQPGNSVFLLAEGGSPAPEHGDLFAEKVGHFQTSVPSAVDCKGEEVAVHCVSSWRVRG